MRRRSIDSSRRDGLTLIEALVAVSILAILLAAVVPAFTNALRINTRSETRSQAVAAAQTLPALGGISGDLRLQPGPIEMDGDPIRFFPGPRRQGKPC